MSVSPDGVADPPLRGLEALFTSRSIAVVGASDRDGSPGSRIMQILHASGYAGEVIGINPRTPSFPGAASVATLADVRAGPIDHALVLTPAASVPDVLRECIARGVGAVTLISSGVGQPTGLDPADFLRDLVGDSGVRVLGPNCLGVLNAHSGLVASPASAFMSGPLEAGGISIVSQSGAVGAYLVGLLGEVDLGVRFFASTGNELDIRLGEVVRHFAHDPETRSIALYLEGVRDVATFVDALAEARQLGKDVVVIKAGETEAGAAAVRSHTAAMAGDDATYDAVFERLGAYRARSVGEAVQVLRACVTGRRRTGRIRRVAVMTTSGGLGILGVEALIREGFEIPDVPAATGAHLRDVLPLCAPGRPIDLGGSVPSRAEDFRDILDRTVADLALDAMVVVVSNLPRSAGAWPGIRTTLVELVGACPATVAVVGALDEADLALFRGIGAVAASDPADAARELAVLDRLAGLRAGSGTVAHPPEATADEELVAMPDVAAMALLSDHGVNFPEQLVVDLARTGAADGLGSVALPAAVKLLQTGVLHKAAAGNVVTGVLDRDQLERLVRGFQEKAEGEGHVLVQTMVDQAVGEVILSVRRDPTFGSVVVVGTGGRLVELLGDRVLLLEPVSDVDVVDALARLVHLGDLGPRRGEIATEITGVVRALLSVLEQEPGVHEVEINPVILRSTGPVAVAVDAVVLVAAPEHDPAEPMRSSR